MEIKTLKEIKERIGRLSGKRLTQEERDDMGIEGRVDGYIECLEDIWEGKTDNEIKRILEIITGDMLISEWKKYGIKIKGGVIGYTSALKWVLNKNGR